MKERPILFNTEMVQAVLAGRKTQTRRVVKPQPEINNGIGRWRNSFSYEQEELFDLMIEYKSPYGEPGDLLWVRETWTPFHEGGDCGVGCEYGCYHGSWIYKASTFDPDEIRWKPSIFMPKEASRIWLRVTDVRVERVQDISTEDIKAEGVTIPMNDGPLIPLNDKHFPHEYLGEFITKNRTLGEDEFFGAFWVKLWNSINADRGYSWESNPWVWVVYFEVISTEGKP